MGLTCNRICILGVLHDYQLWVYRKDYIRTVKELMEMHAVDLVAEEAPASFDTFARKFVDHYKTQVTSDLEWRGVDPDGNERKGIPDANPRGIGTLVDLDFQDVREWWWIARTLGSMKHSVLFICGWAHTFSLAGKFRWLGLTVEVNVFGPPKSDIDAIRAIVEKP